MDAILTGRPELGPEEARFVKLVKLADRLASLPWRELKATALLAIVFRVIDTPSDSEELDGMASAGMGALISRGRLNARARDVADKLAGKPGEKLEPSSET